LHCLCDCIVGSTMTLRIAEVFLKVAGECRRPPPFCCQSTSPVSSAGYSSLPTMNQSDSGN
jgi:hypothetical protein